MTEFVLLMVEIVVMLMMNGDTVMMVMTTTMMTMGTSLRSCRSNTLPNLFPDEVQINHHGPLCVFSWAQVS